MTLSWGSRVLKGAAIIGVFTLLSKGLGLVQKLVIAGHFGTGIDADAYTLAYSSIVFVFFAIPQQLLAPFLPLFTERREKDGPAAAWGFAFTVGVLLAVVMITAVATGIFSAPFLVSRVSAFQSAEAHRLAVGLARLMLPAALFMAFFYFGSLLLNANKQFAIPAFGDTLNKILLILILFALYQRLGIWALAVGVVVGSAGAAALQAIALWRLHAPWPRGLGFHDPTLRRFAMLLPPIIVAIFASQLRTILDYRFASGMGQGYASSLSYARGLSDTLILLVASAVGVAIYPFFADLTAEGDRERLTAALMNSMRMMVFVFAPLTVALVALRVPVVQLVFQRGQFGPESVALTSGPLGFYAAGLCVFAVEILLMRFYFALKNTWTPTWIGLACVGVHVAVILCLRGSLRHDSIALAATVSKTVKVLALLALLGPCIAGFQWKKNAAFAIRLLLASAGMTAVLVLGYRLVPLTPGESASNVVVTLFLMARLAVAGGLGMLAFVGVGLALHMEEAQAMFRFVPGMQRYARARPDR